MNGTRIILIVGATIIICSAVSSVAALWLYAQYEDRPENRIADFYATEAAVSVSPHGLRKELDKGGGSFVLVDLRSHTEYEKEHIVSAVNIPAYSDPDTSAYHEKDRILQSFQEIIAKNPHKDIVVYCYSMPCMTGRKIGNILAEEGIYVKHLGIGWNEWRYFKTLWNHEHEWSSVKIEDYVISGSEPGEPTRRELPSQCGAGEFSC